MASHRSPRRGACFPMEVQLFDPNEEIILVSARVPSGSSLVRMAFDTAAAGVFIVPRVVHRLGYTDRDTLGRSTVTSPLGTERGRKLRLQRFEALGFRFENFLIHAHELASSLEVEGLL